MSISVTLISATTYLRNKGLRRFAGTAVATFLIGRRRWYVTREDLTSWSGAEPRVPGLQIGLASEKDLAALRRLPQWPSDGPEAWFTPERFLFLALKDGEVISYRGLTTGVHPLVRDVLKLRPDQIYEADIYTVPEFRRRGISRALNIVAAPLLLSRGYREAISLQRTNAVEAIAASRAKGVPHVGVITRTQVLGMAWLRFDPL